MLYLSQIKQKKFNIGKFEEEKPVLIRQPLHAFSLIFNHPETGALIECTAPIPKDMAALIKQLEKWDNKRSVI
jgi:23S rRNA-/tRNA-specific pseudouridylate synthase